MTKKDFKSGLNSLLTPSRESKKTEVQISSVEHKAFVTYTLRINKEALSKVKEIAYWERKDIKDVIDEALAKYLETHKIRKD